MQEFILQLQKERKKINFRAFFFKEDCKKYLSMVSLFATGNLCQPGSFIVKPTQKLALKCAKQGQPYVVKLILTNP